jgi:hypothetical protein
MLDRAIGRDFANCVHSDYFASFRIPDANFRKLFLCHAWPRRMHCTAGDMMGRMTRPIARAVFFLPIELFEIAQVDFDLNDANLCAISLLGSNAMSPFFGSEVNSFTEPSFA